MLDLNSDPMDLPGSILLQSKPLSKRAMRKRQRKRNVCDSKTLQRYNNGCENNILTLNFD